MSYHTEVAFRGHGADAEADSSAVLPSVAKLTTAQEPPTHLQQEDTDFMRYFGKPVSAPLLLSRNKIMDS